MVNLTPTDLPPDGTCLSLSLAALPAVLAHRRGRSRRRSGPGERAGVRGKPTFLLQSAYSPLPAREDPPKGRMALSHSSFQASGFTGGCRLKILQKFFLKIRHQIAFALLDDLVSLLFQSLLELRN